MFGSINDNNVWRKTTARLVIKQHGMTHTHTLTHRVLCVLCSFGCIDDNEA